MKVKSVFKISHRNINEYTMEIPGILEEEITESSLSIKIRPQKEIEYGNAVGRGRELLKWLTRL